MPGGMKESSLEIRGVSSGSSSQERKFSISDQELYGSNVAQRNLFLVNLLLPVYRVSGRRIESPFSLVSRASGRAIRPRNVNVRFPVSSRKEWIRSIRGEAEGWFDTTDRILPGFLEEADRLLLAGISTISSWFEDLTRVCPPSTWNNSVNNDRYFSFFFKFVPETEHSFCPLFAVVLLLDDFRGELSEMENQIG